MDINTRACAPNVLCSPRNHLHNSFCPGPVFAGSSLCFCCLKPRHGFVPFGECSRISSLRLGARTPVSRPLSQSLRKGDGSFECMRTYVVWTCQGVTPPHRPLGSRHPRELCSQALPPVAAWAACTKLLLCAENREARYELSSWV